MEKDVKKSTASIFTIMKKEQFNISLEDFVERVERKKQEKMTTVKKEKICFTETDRQTDRNKEMCNITTLIRDSCIDKQKHRQRLRFGFLRQNKRKTEKVSNFKRLEIFLHSISPHKSIHIDQIYCFVRFKISVLFYILASFKGFFKY